MAFADFFHDPETLELLIERAIATGVRVLKELHKARTF